MSLYCKDLSSSWKWCVWCAKVWGRWVWFPLLSPPQKSQTTPLCFPENQTPKTLSSVLFWLQKHWVGNQGTCRKSAELTWFDNCSWLFSEIISKEQQPPGRPVALWKIMMLVYWISICTSRPPLTTTKHSQTLPNFLATVNFEPPTCRLTDDPSYWLWKIGLTGITGLCWRGPLALADDSGKRLKLQQHWKHIQMYW